MNILCCQKTWENPRGRGRKPHLIYVAETVLTIHSYIMNTNIIDKVCYNTYTFTSGPDVLRVCFVSKSGLQRPCTFSQILVAYYRKVICTNYPITGCHIADNRNPYISEYHQPRWLSQSKRVRLKIISISHLWLHRQSQ